MSFVNSLFHGDGEMGYVMTDEQIQQLRKQISIYATLTDQLIDMYHARMVHHGSSNAGTGFDNVHHDHQMTPDGRRRWTPTAAQLQILEEMFGQGNGRSGTPSKEKIKEITGVLSRHGHISEKSVYNWFQNRRARAKKKQPAT